MIDPILKLTLLGTGTCVPNPKRNASGYVVTDGQTILSLDMGHGIMGQMMRANVDYRQIDGILITHYHPDHVTDLIPFLFATRHTPGFKRTKPLEIVGGVGLIDYLGGMASLFGNWVQSPDFPLETREMVAGETKIAGLKITSAPVVHSKGAVAYRIWAANGKSITYSGDTGYCDEIVALAKDTDILLIECSFPAAKKFGAHLTPQEVGEIARQANCKTVVLTHQYPLFDDECPADEVAKIFSGHVVDGKDLLVLQVD